MAADLAPGTVFGMAKPKRKTWRPIKLKQWRKFRGLSVEKLAELSGVSPGQISLLEQNKAGYSDESLVKLADALQCTRGEILDVDPMKGRPILSLWEEADAETRNQIETVARALVAARGRG